MNIKNYFLVALALLTLLALSGCTSVIVHTMPVCPYEGIKMDAQLMMALDSGVVILPAIDFPFSFLMDTLLLPLDLIRGENC